MATVGPQAFSPEETMAVPTGGFVYTPTDTGDGIIDPNATPKTRLVRNIISTVAGVIRVTYLDGSVDDVPVIVGSNPMVVRKIWETGTTAGITSAGVHLQY